MDISSLPEAEQKQLQQLHQQFKEHQAQQNENQQNQIYEQQQQQQYGDYSYYPQSYDYSSYYQQPDQHHYPYHLYDYSAAYQQPLPHQHAQSVGVATNSVQFAAAPSQQPNAGQLSQFPGNMEAAHSTMPGVHFCLGSMPPASGPQYQGGGGRRGRGSFRGGARGNFGHRNLSSGASGPPSGGKGQNKAKGIAKPKVSSSTGNIGPNQQPARGLRCEICEVECNSLEILENHMNGKKHKKNILKIEASNKFPKPSSEIQNLEQPSIGPEPKENFQSHSTQEAKNGNPKAENDQQPQNSTVGPTELTAESRKRGAKRKMTAGGKKIKAWKMEPTRQPKLVIPIVCGLCNVKCDTREVFEKHLAGKKHIGKLKRFEGHQNMYGPIGLQALYPPNPIAQTHLDNGPQHSVYGGPQGSNLPTIAYAPPQSYQAVGPTVSGGLDPYNPFNHAAVVASEAGSQNGALSTP